MLTSLRQGLAALLLSASLHAAPIDDYTDTLRRFQARSASIDNIPLTKPDAIERARNALATSMPTLGIGVGGHAPDFTLPDASGKSVQLYHELKKGPVVLEFCQRTWCPDCNLHLHALLENLPQFDALGARLIVVTPLTPSKLLERFKPTPHEFDVLSDDDRKVMGAYRLSFEMDADLVAIYRKHGLDLFEDEGAGRDVLPALGTFVIDQNGLVRAMQAGTDYTLRMEPAEIVRALEKLYETAGS